MRVLVVLVVLCNVVIAAPYPDPPQQHAAWTAPKLDAKLLDATKRLFDQGFADPRGCEYREIEIVVTSGMEDAATPLKTHGWVIPKTQFAIAWNGLVYKTTTIGAAADVAADIRAALAALDKQIADIKQDDPTYEYFAWPAAEEGFYATHTSFAGGKAVMLARLGDAALAAKVWKATNIKSNAYALLVADWLYSMYMRGVGAHHRGEVELAVESWRRLPALVKAARTDVSGDGVTAGDQGVAWLGDIDALLADEQRRAANPAPPIDFNALAKLSAKDRVAKLIAALDQATVGRFSGPDPIVKALAAEGEAAVEPLIVVYQTDNRFTRSRFVDWKHSDAGRYRNVIPVHEVAHDLLAQLVDLTYFQPKATDRKALGDEIRAYWKQWKGITPVERQYQTFANDKLDEWQWQVAAQQITALQSGKLMGEALRKKTSPSVTALFEKRLNAGYTDLRARATMLHAWVAWDTAAAKTMLAKTVRDAFAAWKPNEGMAPYLGEALAMLTTDRIAAGDNAALKDYADWIVTTAPEQAQFAARNWLAPMIAHRDNPDIAKAAKMMWSGKSVWVPLTAKRAGFYSIELLSTDMIQVVPFREHALEQLKNKSKLGTMKYKKGGLDIRTESFQTGEGVDLKDPKVPKDGWTDTLRVCDEYASMLMQGRMGPAIPTFRRYWPVAERDRVIATIVEWLKKQ